jgi:hypothetical protein
LRESNDISVTPFDKGQGFITINTEKLVEKTTAEFKNVQSNTTNKTDLLQTKIQNKLKKLKGEGKLSEMEY